MLNAQVYSVIQSFGVHHNVCVCECVCLYVCVCVCVAYISRVFVKGLLRQCMKLL